MMTDYRDGESVRAFTLIELLTVIAIIAILAAILIPTVSVAMRKAKVSAAEHDLKNISTALSDYAIDNGTLPPRPGCAMRDIQPNNPTFWTPYLARLEMIGKDVQGQFYDRFSESEDLNRDDIVGGPFRNGGEAAAEDQPTRVIIDPITKAERFDPPNGRVDPGQVPYQYFPVNSTNLAKFRQLLSEVKRSNPGVEPDKRAYTLDELRKAGLTFPEQSYDKFVLFSLGPQGSDQGIIPRNADNPHDLRLRAYYRATRDLNDTGTYDFDYRARSKKQEIDPETGLQYELPDGTYGYGVIILSGP
jgi:prepilin-type N-terminal cleavage/methylation domain-containing protein